MLLTVLRNALVHGHTSDVFRNSSTRRSLVLVEAETLHVLVTLGIGGWRNIPERSHGLAHHAYCSPMFGPIDQTRYLTAVFDARRELGVGYHVQRGAVPLPPLDKHGSVPGARCHIKAGLGAHNDVETYPWKERASASAYNA